MHDFFKRAGYSCARLLLFLLITGEASFAQQQPVSFTQYMDNLTPFNPAYSLLNNAGVVQMLGRRQWAGIEGAPVTYSINANLPLPSPNSSAGVFIYNDQLAIEKQTEVNAYFAKGLQVGNNSFLAVSLNAGIRNYAANYSTLDAADPTFKDDVRFTKPNVGFGILYYTDWYYLGLSLPEITLTSLGTASVQNKVNFSSHYYFSGAMIADLNEEIKFKPAALLAYTNGLPLRADISGTVYAKETLGLGINYSTRKQMAGILSLNFNAIHIGYSYSFGMASANPGPFNNAVHEVSIFYRFSGGQLKLL